METLRLTPRLFTIERGELELIATDEAGNELLMIEAIPLRDLLDRYESCPFYSDFPEVSDVYRSNPQEYINEYMHPLAFEDLLQKVCNDRSVRWETYDEYYQRYLKELELKFKAA